jgi:putative acetyltransferase
VRKLTQKIPDAQGHPGLITKLYLNPAEYEALKGVPAAVLAKRRYNIARFGIDVFDGDLAGLILADIEFDTDDARQSFQAPPWAIADVTHDVRFTGGRLVETTSTQLLDLLTTFGIAFRPMAPSGYTIRPMDALDLAVVLPLVDAAFGDPKPRRLVALIRRSGRLEPQRSLVAVAGDEIVGHGMLSRIELVTANAARAVLNLSPLAVLPGHRDRGVGRALVEGLLELAEAHGEPFVLVEGDPRYYGPLGFERASTLGIDRPSERIPDSAFQVYRLTRWSDDWHGQIEYPAAFWDAGAVGPS